MTTENYNKASEVINNYFNTIERRYNNNELDSLHLAQLISRAITQINAYNRKIELSDPEQFELIKIRDARMEQVIKLISNN